MELSEILRYFSELIEKETGIQYNQANSFQLNSRLVELATSLGFANLEELWNEVKNKGLSSEARKSILDLATNNETSFFRDTEVFEFFSEVFVKKRMVDTNRISIWCAATSTGQEPYSLAIAMDQLKNATGNLKSYEILCTDISERVLQQASKGIYSQLEIQRGLNPALIDKYFIPTQIDSSKLSYYRVLPELSSHMKFQTLNLLDAWPNIGNFHIIFCRNVLIYQSVERKRKIIERMSQILYPGGYLVLGGAESMMGLSDKFQFENYGKACVYRLNS